MGKNYIRMKQLEKQIVQIEAQDKPTNLWVLIDNNGKFTRGSACTEIKGRLNTHTTAREIMESEFNAFKKTVDGGRIHTIIEDIVSEVLETVE